LQKDKEKQEFEFEKELQKKNYERKMREKKIVCDKMIQLRNNHHTTK
jgi:hypothetical protein